MIRDFLAGASYIVRGFSIAKTPGLKRYIAVPLAINILLFSAASWWAWRLLQEYVLDSLPSWLEWLAWILIPAFSIAVLLIVFYAFTLVANLIGAPFNSLLAEKVEQHLDGRTIEQHSNLSSIAGGISSSIVSEIRKLLYLVFWSIPLLILFLIPGINVAAPFLWMAFSAWIFSLEYIDHPMGNHNYNFGQQRRILKKNRWLAWGFGSTTLLITLIPFVNFFAMPVAVIGATALWVDRLRNNIG